MNITRSVLLIPLLTLGCSFFESEVSFEHRAVVLVGNINENGWPTHAIGIDSVTTTFGGPLRAHVWYGGGCADHRIALIVETVFAKSQPPALRARLAHEGNGDPCDAIVQETIDFDLALLRHHFHASYPFSQGEFVLNVQGTPRLVYRFQ